MALGETSIRVYEFIRAYKIRTMGRAPTVRDIGKGVGIPSTSNVNYHLDVLEDVGLIVRETHSTARTINLAGEQYVPPTLPDYKAIITTRRSVRRRAYSAYR